jgi:hypothetical protein
MRLQLFSDLHLEFSGGWFPKAAPDATHLVLVGDVGHEPDWILQFGDWPVPVIYVPGNHEYDKADYDDTRIEIQEVCAQAGLLLLDRSTLEIVDPEDSTRTIRFVGTTRWCDFDLLGKGQRDRCMESAQRYLRHTGVSRYGRMLDAAGVRDIGLLEREWLETTLQEPFNGPTVAITHFGPSGKSCDPRYGLAPGTASFCNADDDLFQYVDLWLHGHLHCPHDYKIDNARKTRVVCNPRGYERLNEPDGYQEQLVISI